MKQIRFSFDWGTSKCLWDDQGLICYNGLGLSAPLCNLLDELGNEMQSALNWEDPTSPSLWSPAQKSDFIRRAKNAYDRICRELDNRYTVIYHFSWFEK